MRNSGTHQLQTTQNALLRLTDARVHAGEAFDDLRTALQAAARCPATSARHRSQNVGVAYVVFAVDRPARFRRMRGYGTDARDGILMEGATAAYRVARDVLVAALADQDEVPEFVSEAEVLGWWSVVHGLAFLAIDGHLRGLRASPKHLEYVVRSVLRSLEHVDRDSPRSSFDLGVCR
jgi:hypothetical protein